MENGGEVGDTNKAFEDEECESKKDEVEVDTVRMDMEKKLRVHTIRVLCFTMFVGSISFSIVMSSLWPYLRKIDPRVKESYLGWVNSAYSLSQLASSVAFGYWCDRRPAIEPLLLSISLLGLGNALYAYAEAFGTCGIWAVLGARIMTGISAGNLSVCRAVAAHIAEKKHLPKTMSYLSMFQSLGFLIGPALQAAAKPAGNRGIYVPDMKLYFNIYTAPCFLMIAISLMNLVLALKYFHGEIDNSKKKHKDEEERHRAESLTYPPVSKVALTVMLIAFFVSMSVFALNETILSPLLMNLYAWTRDDTVFYGGIILAVSGLIGILCYVFIAPLCKLFKEKTIIVGGLVILAMGFVVELPWGPGHMKLTSSDGNGTEVGCPHEYGWCSTTPQLPLPQYFVAGTLVCIGYPVAFVLVNVLYAKIIGPHPQGAYMGWLSGVGSLARVLGPLYVTFLWVHLGIRWMAASTAVIITCVIILLLVTWKRLIPYYELYPQEDPQQQSKQGTAESYKEV